MKTIAALLSLFVCTTAAFAQGTVVFANGPTTLISYSPGGLVSTLPASPVGSYYFGLLTGFAATGPFTFSGVYATNTAGAGKLGPATYTPAVPGWATGTKMFFEVLGWSASLGTTFDPAWLTGFGSGVIGSQAWVGMSNVGSGFAGGGVAPPLPIFGGTGVAGFVLTPSIPEPSCMALSALSAAAVLVFRRRK